MPKIMTSDAAVRLDFGRLYGRRAEESVLLNKYYSCFCRPPSSSPLPSPSFRASGSSNSSINSPLPSAARRLPCPASVVLLSGESGSGKTALARNLRIHALEDGGEFLCGTFCPSSSSTGGGSAPYSAFDAAFAPYCRRIFAGSSASDEVTAGSHSSDDIDALRNSLGPEGRALADALPCLTPLFGPVSSEVAVDGEEDKEEDQTVLGVHRRRSSLLFVSNSRSSVSSDADPLAVVPVGTDTRPIRLRRALRRLVSCVSGPDESPVVLLLDDLQWADASSLELVSDLASNSGGAPLLLLLTWRDEEWGKGKEMEERSEPGQSFRSKSVALSFLRQLDKEREVTNVNLGPLQKEDVRKMVAGALGLARKPYAAGSLADLVYHRTGGNPFFITQYLLSLQESKLITYDVTTDMWIWDVERLRSTQISDNVVELVVRKIRRLSGKYQEVLKIAACIGSDLNENILEIILETSSDVVNGGSESRNIADTASHSLQEGSEGGKTIWSHILSGAVDEGLLIEAPSADGKRFAHDRIRQAAYSLIPPSERCAFHLHIYRLLLERLCPTQLDMHVFIVADQLNRGSHLLSDHNELAEAAKVNLCAAKKAVSLSGHACAASYLDAGISLLGDGHWCSDQYYGLCLALHDESAECARDNVEAIRCRLEVVVQWSQNFQDELRTRTALVNALGLRGQLQEAMDEGLRSLRGLGMRLPRRALKTRLVTEVLWTRRETKRWNDEKILSLQPMTDLHAIAACRLLNHLSFYSFQCRPELTPLIVLRIVRLSWRHGMCTDTPFAFGMYGILCTFLGDVAEGYRFGQLALKLLQVCGTREWTARVFGIVYGVIYPW